MISFIIPSPDTYIIPLYLEGKKGGEWVLLEGQIGRGLIDNHSNDFFFL